MARWRPFRGSQALAALPASPEPATALLEVLPTDRTTVLSAPVRVVHLRAYWTDQAVEALRTTDVPTGRILDAFLDQVTT